MYQANLRKAYSMVLGQCSIRLRQALEASSQWSEIEEEADVFKLMVAIKKQVRNTDTNEHYNADVLAKAVGDFYRLIQHFNQPDDAYFREFKARCDIVHQNGGLLGAHPALVSEYAGIGGSVFDEASVGGSLEIFEARSYPKLPTASVPVGTRAEDVSIRLDQ